MTLPHLWLTNFSRRHLLRSAAHMAGAAALIGTSATQTRAAKVSQGSVAYQSSPKGNQRCGSCRQFQAPSSCKMVEGSISPQGWCRLWVKAKG